MRAWALLLRLVLSVILQNEIGLKNTCLLLKISKPQQKQVLFLLPVVFLGLLSVCPVLACLMMVDVMSVWLKN